MRNDTSSRIVFDIQVYGTGEYRDRANRETDETKAKISQAHIDPLERRVSLRLSFADSRHEHAAVARFLILVFPSCRTAPIVTIQRIVRAVHPRQRLPFRTTHINPSARVASTSPVSTADPTQQKRAARKELNGNVPTRQTYSA